MFLCRIGLVEKQLEDWKFEEKNILDQNERLKERVGSLARLLNRMIYKITTICGLTILHLD